MNRARQSSPWLPLSGHGRGSTAVTLLHGTLDLSFDPVIDGPGPPFPTTTFRHTGLWPISTADADSSTAHMFSGSDGERARPAKKASKAPFATLINPRY